MFWSASSRVRLADAAGIAGHSATRNPSSPHAARREVHRLSIPHRRALTVGRTKHHCAVPHGTVVALYDPLIKSESGDHTSSTSEANRARKQASRRNVGAPRSRQYALRHGLWHHFGTTTARSSACRKAQGERSSRHAPRGCAGVLAIVEVYGYRGYFPVV